MADPRAENCKAFKLDGAGKVSGVELVVVPRPETQFELVRVDLIDEQAAAGNTVASCYVLDGTGIPLPDTVYLAWPFPALPDSPDNRGTPGNPNNQHMITNGYNPPALGPLALYVGRVNGAINSDIVGGLGLPFRHHVCFRATWRLRASVVVPPGPGPDPEPEPEPGPAESPEMLALLGQMLAVATGWAATAGEMAAHVAHVDALLTSWPGAVPVPAPEPGPVDPAAIGAFALARPVKVGDVTQWFGEHPEVYGVYGLAGHEGIDYGVPLGTPVYAAQAGIVTGCHTEEPYGLHVVLEDGGVGVSTVYADLQEARVTMGQFLRVGDLVGLSGSSGRSDGPHLHFGYKVKDVRNPAYADFLDPSLGRELYKRLHA